MNKTIMEPDREWRRSIYGIMSTQKTPYAVYHLLTGMSMEKNRSGRRMPRLPAVTVRDIMNPRPPSGGA